MASSRSITYCQALNEATHQAMERDSRVFLYGIGVPDHTRIYNSLEGIVEQFGEDRCFDVPLCEDTLAGFGLGAALGGLKPVFINIRVDFLLLAMNQLTNTISSCRYNSGGELEVPLVIRAIIGRGWGQGCQHSKSCQSLFAHIPGLKVVMPTTPRDVKGLFLSALEDNNPVIILEHRWLYWQEGMVEEELFTIPIGQGEVLRKGTDITIVATSWMNVEAIHVANILKKHNVSVEVVDAKSIYPLDADLICESVNKTRHCIVADLDWTFCGFSSEVASVVNQHCFHRLEKPVTRIGFAPTPCPTARYLENQFYPGTGRIIREVETLLGLVPIDLSEEEFYSYEKRFKGPF